MNGQVENIVPWRLVGWAAEVQNIEGKENKLSRAEAICPPADRGGSTSVRGRIRSPHSSTIRYDTRCYFNVRSKADMSQLNLPHGTDN